MKKLTLILILFFCCSFTQSKRGQILCNIQNDKVSTYINSIWNIAEEIEIIYGIPLELTIAQSCLETGYGDSKLCRNECNFFGIRNEKFDSKESCFIRYGEMLTLLPCYANLQPKTIEQWYEALDCCGYAEKYTYVRDLKLIIKTYLTIKA